MNKRNKPYNMVVFPQQEVQQIEKENKKHRFSFKMYMFVGCLIAIVFSLSAYAYNGTNQSDIEETIEQIRFDGTYEKGYVVVDTDVQTYIIDRNDVTFTTNDKSMFNATLDGDNELIHVKISLTKADEKKLNKLYAKAFNQTLILSNHDE